MRDTITIREMLEGRFWIWGAKWHGKYFLGKLDFLGVDYKMHAAGVIDSDRAKEHGVFHGLPIWQPEKLREELAQGKRPAVVVCASPKVTAEIEALLDKHYPEVRHTPYNEVVFEHGKDFSKYFGKFMPYGDDRRIISRCCRRDDWDRPGFVARLRQMKIHDPERHIRKSWELAYIAEVLEKAGALAPGKRGIGFAVGEELLPSYFASLGIDITASDLPSGDYRSIGWKATGQHAGGDMSKLWHQEICSREEFFSHIRYRDIDMNQIPVEEHGYDFCWSTCAIEHVGTLELSIAFMKNMLCVLRPGGIAVHTTEFNLSSNDATVCEGGTVLWRKRDVEQLQEWMLSHGQEMEVTFERGTMPADRYVEMSPFASGIKDLICFYFSGYITTGFALVVKKNYGGKR